MSFSQLKADSESVHTVTPCAHSSLQDQDTSITGRYLVTGLNSPSSGQYQISGITAFTILTREDQKLSDSSSHKPLLSSFFFNYKSLSTGIRSALTLLLT